MQFNVIEILRERRDGSHREALWSDVTKRGVDILGALTILIIFSPILLGCAIAIRLSGAKSVFFCQNRVGLNGKPFKILKLTTMKEDAHKSGPLVSGEHDARVTPIGKVMRGLGFNELPQLINVLKGDMSLVGPRPEVPRYVNHWPTDSKERLLSVRPGITGLATVKIWHEAALLEGHDDVERAYINIVMPRKHRLDLWYVSHRNLLLDMKILLETLAKALGASRLFGANHEASESR